MCQNIEQLTVYIKFLNKLSKNNCSFCVCCLCSAGCCFTTEKALNSYLGISNTFSCKMNGAEKRRKKKKKLKNKHRSARCRFVVRGSLSSAPWRVRHASGSSSPQGARCCWVNIGEGLPSAQNSESCCSVASCCYFSEHRPRLLSHQGDAGSFKRQKGRGSASSPSWGRAAGAGFAPGTTSPRLLYRAAVEM